MIIGTQGNVISKMISPFKISFLTLNIRILSSFSDSNSYSNFIVMSWVITYSSLIDMNNGKFILTQF